MGSRDGAVVTLASHQFDPAMSLWLVLALLEGFIRVLRFSSPHEKTASPNPNSTRIEGLNENPLLLSKYFNSNFYFPSATKIVGFHVDKAQMLLVSRWTLKHRIVEYGLLDDFA